MSRETGLMWKLLTFPSLSSLLTDYKAVYEHIPHEVLKVRIGLPVPHDEKFHSKVGGAALWPLSCTSQVMFEMVGRCR